MNGRTTTARCCAVFICTVLGTSAFAQANRTERITLRYLTAVEAEQMLLPPASAEGKGGRGSVLGDRGHLPEGIVAFAADPQAATVSATGSAEALAGLHKIIRLIDIPKRRIRWTIKAVSQDEKLKAAVAAVPDLDALEAERIARDAEKCGGLLFEAALTSTNSQPVRLFAPKATPGQQKLSLQVRVNGDQSVTLILTNSENKSVAARRVASGTSVLLVPEGKTAFLVTAQVLLTPQVE